MLSRKLIIDTQKSVVRKGNMSKKQMEEMIEITKLDYDFLVRFFDKYKKQETIVKYISNNYYTNVKNLDFDKLAIDGIIRGLNDPNAQHLSKNEYENYIMFKNKNFQNSSSINNMNQILNSKIIGDIGFVCISSFPNEVSTQFEKRLQDLQNKNIKALVIDLRNNMGGIIEEAIAVCKQIIPSATITIIVNNKGSKHKIASEGQGFGRPIYVLVNSKTGSASEMLAAAVQDNKVGFIIGQCTYGKGTIQNVVKMQDGSGIKLSIAEFFTPKGKKINGIGLVPDYIIDEDNDILDIVRMLIRKNESLQKGKLL